MKRQSQTSFTRAAARVGLKYVVVPIVMLFGLAFVAGHNMYQGMQRNKD